MFKSCINITYASDLCSIQIVPEITVVLSKNKNGDRTTTQINLFLVSCCES